MEIKNLKNKADWELANIYKNSKAPFLQKDPRIKELNKRNKINLIN